MARSLAVFVIGAALGVIAAYSALRAVQDGPAGSVGLLQPVATSGNVAEPSKLSFVDARLSAFLDAAELPDVPSVAQKIESVANAPPSPRRDTELEALLMRYLEMDPRGAIRFAVGLPVDGRLIAYLFRAWASVDSDEALAELAEVHDDNLRRSVAIELVGVHARTLDEIEHLAAVAGERNPEGFLVDALVQLSSADPQNALRQALSLQGFSLRVESLERIAKEWARLRAADALMHTSEISTPLFRNLFHAAVVTEWASVDPDQALEYLVSAEGQRLLAILPGDVIASVASRIALHRPDEVLSAVTVISGMPGQLLRRAALRRLVDQDLSAAMAQLEALPARTDRRELGGLIGAAYARQDPERALEWARNLDEALALVAMEVILTEIARTDLVSAIGLALEDGRAAHQVARVLSAGEVQLSEWAGDQFLSVADRVLASRQPQQRAMEVLMRSWSQRDPTGAWNWLVHQEAAARASILESTANAFASNGVAIPMHSVYELPYELRGDWVVAFASRYAEREPEAAVDWVRTFEGDPDYDAWAIGIANVLVTFGGRGDPRLPRHPRPAAELLSTLNRPTPEVTATVASSLAQQEPEEAVQWGLELSDPEAQMVAMSAAIGAWTVDDPGAAQRRVLSLPNGEMRDRALAAQLAQEIASHGSVDRRILNAFSSNRALQEALSQRSFAFAFERLGSREPETAKALLDDHVDDANLRQSIRADIDSVLERGFEFHKDLILDVVP